MWMNWVWILGLFGTPSQQEFDRYYEELSVVLYQLQINVTDKNGDPITDLGPADFEILLEGQAQKIEGLEYVNINQMPEMNPSTPAISQQARRVFVFFFDLRYSSKRGVLSAREASRDFVQNQMAPADLVGIFTYTPINGIQMAANFTSDTGLLLTALDDLGLDKSKHTIDGPAGYFLSEMLNDFQRRLATGGSGRGGSADMAEDYFLEMVETASYSERRNYDREVLQFLENFKAFASGLKYIRGRKNLVWFSSGFDSSGLVGESMDQLKQNSERIINGDISRVSSNQLGSSQIQNASTQVVEELQASGAVLFALDTSLLDGMSSQKTGLQTLNFFSVDSGGRVYTNSNNLSDSLEKVEQITSGYYLARFTPEAKLKPGEVGKIKVKVNRPGVRVYASKGLLLDPDFKNMSRLEKAIQLSEFLGRDQISRAIPVEVDLMPLPFHKEMGRAFVQADIDPHFLFVTGSAKKRELEIYTQAIDLATQEVFDQDWFIFEIDPSRMEAQKDSATIRYMTSLFMKPGTYRIKMVVRDGLTGKVGSWIQDYQQDGSAESCLGRILTRSSKMVLKEPEEFARKKRLGDLDFSAPFALDGQQPLPAINAQIGPKTAILDAWFLLDSPKQAGQPQISLMLEKPDGSYQPIASEWVQAHLQNQAGRMSAYLPIQTQKLGLQPGTYTLFAQFQFENNSPLRTQVPFEVMP